MGKGVESDPEEPYFRSGVGKVIFEKKGVGQEPSNPSLKAGFLKRYINYSSEFGGIKWKKILIFHIILRNLWIFFLSKWGKFGVRYSILRRSELPAKSPICNHQSIKFKLRRIENSFYSRPFVVCETYCISAAVCLRFPTNPPPPPKTCIYGETRMQLK